MNKHLSWLVLGSLALSLLFNAFALREVFLQSDKLGQLQAQLTEVTNTVHSLNGRLQSIANQLSGAQAAEMWLMSSEFVADASKSSREAVSLTLQVMLQEVARDANVSVLYTAPRAQLNGPPSAPGGRVPSFQLCSPWIPLKHTSIRW